MVAKLSGIEFNKFATGHYARVVEENGRFLLKKGVAPHKDQSYFLYRLKQEQLKHIILATLGEYTKDKIREIARENHLERLPINLLTVRIFYGGDYNELLGVCKEKSRKSC